MEIKATEFYGSLLGSLRVPGFTFTERAYGARTKLPKHSHQLAHLSFGIEGDYTQGFESKELLLNRLSLIVCPPGVEHWKQHHTAGRHFLIEVDASRYDSLEAVRSRPNSFQTGALPTLAARLYREFRRPDMFSSLSAEGIALELLAGAMRHANASFPTYRAKCVAIVLAILREEFPALPRLSSLAKAAGVHPVYLATAFRKSQGCTIGEYVRRGRIDQARQRLCTSNDPLAQIAIESGFADQTHFTRTFRKITGMTPAECRHTRP